MNKQKAVLGCTKEHYEKLGLKKNHIEMWEDGMRTDGSEDTYEWWYFDSHLSDGSKLVIVFFTKHYTDVSRPLSPLVTLSLEKPDGTKVDKVYQLDDINNFYASKEQCDVRIGTNTFKGDLNTYNIHVAIDEICADIGLKRNVPSWRPETGYWLFGDNEEYNFSWLPSVPNGEIKGTININGDQSTFEGVGYHDHNWGNIGMMNVLNNWYWGRAQIGQYTVISCYIQAEEQYGYQPFPVFMVSKNNEIIAEDGQKICFSTDDRYIDTFSSKPVSNILFYEYNDEEYNIKVKYQREDDIYKYRMLDVLSPEQQELAKKKGFDGAYLRFKGEIQFELKHGNSIEEFSNHAIWELMYFGKVKD